MVRLPLLFPHLRSLRRDPDRVLCVSVFLMLPLVCHRSLSLTVLCASVQEYPPEDSLSRIWQSCQSFMSSVCLCTHTHTRWQSERPTTAALKHTTPPSRTNYTRLVVGPACLLLRALSPGLSVFHFCSDPRARVAVLIRSVETPTGHVRRLTGSDACSASLLCGS